MFKIFKNKSINSKNELCKNSNSTKIEKYSYKVEYRLGCGMCSGSTTLENDIFEEHEIKLGQHKNVMIGATILNKELYRCICAICRSNEYCDSKHWSIENKQDLVQYQKKYNCRINRSSFYEYTICVLDFYDDLELSRTDCEIVFSSLDNYKLIESLEEFRAYYQSKLSCNDWCKKKLIEKMMELNLREGFISSFADLIGNDLKRYHQMINLASEVENKDVLMYLFVNKFGDRNG